MTPAEFRETLKALGWSQRDLASRLGVTQSSVSRWCTGSLELPQYAAAYLEVVIENQRLHQAIEAISRLSLPCGRTQPAGL